METITVTLEQMIAGGKCISTTDDGKKVLVSGGLNGEKVEAKVISEKKDFSEAVAVKIISENPNRVTPKCPKFSSCGGCNLQFASSDYQVELKKAILHSALERNGINFPKDDIIIVRDKDWDYRNRFQLHKGCLFERGTNFFSEKESLVPFENCCIAKNEIKQYFSDKEHLDEAKKYDKYFVFSGDEVFCSPSQDDNDTNKKSVIGKKNTKAKSGGKRKIYEGTNFNNRSVATAKIDGKEISFDVRGFFQSNLGMLEKTAQIIKEDFYGENLIDIYAGCGTFSVILSENFKHSTLVEHNRDAIVFAEMNLKNTKLSSSHESFGLSGEKFVSLHSPSVVRLADGHFSSVADSHFSTRTFDAAVVDPPRSGMEKSIVNWLCHSNIPRIRSLSCDPVTHARDISHLVEAGYSIKKLYLLDYYPQTSHIESLAFLEKDF